MAKKRKRKYSRGVGTEVKREMHRYKRGKAKSGKGGKGGKVKSRRPSNIVPRVAGLPNHRCLACQPAGLSHFRQSTLPKIRPHVCAHVPVTR